MNVNIEFFDKEPMENLVTCLNYQMDKVIYFGTEDVMTEKRKRVTKDALKRLCGMKEIWFIPVKNWDLSHVVQTMEEYLTREEEQGNNCFFDLTGGKHLILVAMGILSTRHRTAMHQYDIYTGKLHNMTPEGELSLAQVPKREVKLTIEDVIRFWGGRINYEKQKLSKNVLENPKFEALAMRLWEVCNRDPAVWNEYSMVFKNLAEYCEERTHTVHATREAIAKTTAHLRRVKSVKQVTEFLKELKGAGALSYLKEDGHDITFSYADRYAQEILQDAGLILELHTYYEMVNSQTCSDCGIGVHIDWDGEFGGVTFDVENEIDVLAIQGYRPVFISCKNGKVDQMALYELQTVAQRFGGKYSIKTLEVSQELSKAHAQRAKEMEITVS